MLLAGGSLLASAGSAQASYTVHSKYDTLRACVNAGQVVGGSYWTCQGPKKDGKYWLYTDDGVTD